MSFVTTQPEVLYASAGDLQHIATAINAENTAAAGPTMGISPAASDEVSLLTAAQFNAHAHMYQTIAAQAAAIHEQFVSTLGLSANSYAITEAANVASAG